MTNASIYNEYQEGNISPLHALRALCMSLGEVENELETLTAERERLREVIGDIVTTFDNQKAEVADFGLVRITAPSVTEKYDTKQVDALVTWLIDQGRPGIAERLAACKTKGMRMGGLRIERKAQS